MVCIYLSSIYIALVKRNHSVTMVLPMVERLRNWPLVMLHRYTQHPATEPLTYCNIGPTPAVYFCII